VPKRGIGLHVIDVGGDIANGLSKLFYTIAGAFAEAERDRIGERVLDTKADQKKRGRFLRDCARNAVRPLSGGRRGGVLAAGTLGDARELRTSFAE
jgi:DNA invertase Pin-like site-specific DNA recombinase